MTWPAVVSASEHALLAAPKLTPGVPIETKSSVRDLDISHFFVGEEYAKLTKIDPGLKLTQHVHRFDHRSMLLIGSVLLEVDGKTTEHEAPATLIIKAGKAHSVTALTPVLWACLWENRGGLSDPDLLDESVQA